MSDPRRVLYVDAGAGAAGDMLLGGLVDVGVPLSVIRGAARSLPVAGWTLSTRFVDRCGLRARKVRVGTREDATRRRWRDVARIVRAAGLDARVERDALAVFRRLFEAEAAVHGIPLDRVHLHEAGAVDALVDVVGTCAAVAWLAPDRVVVSPLTTGSGRVRCAHGTYPVPAPATQNLLIGVPSTGGGLDGERLTPTGAAILTTLADAWGPPPAMVVRAVGHGAGDRDDPDVANVVRIVVGDDAGRDEVAPEVCVVECTVDDLPGQNLAWSIERLLDAGALDAWVAPVIMKKGRPGHVVTALVRPEGRERIAGVLLRETSTLGVRFRTESRVELDREVVSVRTRFGTIRVKRVVRDDAAARAWPEYEDCAAAARTFGVPLVEVQRAALDAHARGRPGRRRKRGTNDDTGGRR